MTPGMERGNLCVQWINQYKSNVNGMKKRENVLVYPSMEGNERPDEPEDGVDDFHRLLCVSLTRSVRRCKGCQVLAIRAYQLV